MDHARRVDVRHCPSAFLIFLFLLVQATGRAQQTNMDKLGLHVGWGQYLVRDRLMTPLTYSYKFPSFKIVYYGTTSREKHFVQYAYHSGRLTSSGDSWMNGICHQFEYDYHRLIRSGSQGSSRLFLGGNTYNVIASRQGFFHIKEFGNMDSEYTSGEYLLTVNLSVLAEHTFGSRYTVCVQSSLPLLAYVVRPHYSITDSWSFKDGQLRSMVHYFLNTTALAFETTLGKRFSLNGKYTLVYYSIDDPFNIRSFSNEIGTEILFSF